jgi:hypothetical protein
MATLNVNEILQDTLDAFKASVPMLGAFSTDFSTGTAVKDTQIIAHISSLPTASTYDNTTGFLNGVQEADALIADVPVTLNQLKHVPIRVKYITQIASKKDLYREQIRNYAYVLGKDMVDYCLGLVTPANITHGKAEPIANTTLDTLESVRSALTTQKASSMGRFGVVNTSFAGALQADTRIASGDYYGQLNGTTGYRTFKNIAGFENVYEYPDLPATGNLSGFFGERRAIVVASRLPEVNSMANQLGIPSIANFYTVTDPETGLSLLGIAWQQPGTFDVIVTAALLYGASVGAQGGAADSITDKAGYRVYTS